MKEISMQYGIDLGTTNSLIARFEQGEVECLKNPNGHKESLPSYVGFRNDRILIGDKAKTYGERDPKNVFSRFKRKMGTTESFPVSNLNKSMTPVQLSAELLKELKGFCVGNEVPNSVVITIPASFDMIQSNATKDAGVLAGFNDVVLLQEPIAASLAYANSERGIDLEGKQWIVYDLGGGTFDVALVKVLAGELRVVDHTGDNFLGGGDFDSLIVEKIIVPHLEAQGAFDGLFSGLKSASGKYNKIYYSLLALAEEAKVELSANTSAEIDFERFIIEDDDGKQIGGYLPVTRSEFEALISRHIDSTAEMLGHILTRNSVRPSELDFVVMVGGSSFIPLVRSRIGELLESEIRLSIDPTTAICLGAAYFASTTKSNSVSASEKALSDESTISVKAVYEKITQEHEELFTAKFSSAEEGFTYRLLSNDKSYDSGRVPLTQRISIELPLRTAEYNVFTLHLFDDTGAIVKHNLPPITIAQGKYAVSGQLLPDDLSLVKDDVFGGNTILDMIFARNTVLPSKVIRTVEVSRTMIKGTNDELKIIVVEGDNRNHFSANLAVGRLVLSASSLENDLYKGTEIDLTFFVSESRELTVNAFINPDGPEFSQIYNSNSREVNIEDIVSEIQILDETVEKELQEAIESEEYDRAEELKKLQYRVSDIAGDAILLSVDDTSDDRYKLDENKRDAAKVLSQLTSGKEIEELITDYHSTKESTSDMVFNHGNDSERIAFKQIIAHEHAIINSGNPRILSDATSKLHQLQFGVLQRSPEFLVSWFTNLTERVNVMNDVEQARQLQGIGEECILNNDFEQLSSVNMRLHFLLPQEEKGASGSGFFTGIA
jgi:molecular chaperone DnaK